MNRDELREAAQAAISSRHQVAEVMLLVQREVAAELRTVLDGLYDLRVTGSPRDEHNRTPTFAEAIELVGMRLDTIEKDNQ